MSAKNKNSKKKSHKKFDVKIDGVKIFSSRTLILLFVLPTIIAGFFWVRNAKYKLNVVNLQNKLYTQEKKINRLDSQVFILKSDISKKQTELNDLEKQVNNYVILNSNLSLEKQKLQNSILTDISVMQQNIYSINNQINLIKKSLQPKKQAKKNM